jgi:hypothetical protein
MDEKSHVPPGSVAFSHVKCAAAPSHDSRVQHGSRRNKVAMFAAAHQAMCTNLAIDGTPSESTMNSM